MSKLILTLAAAMSAAAIGAASPADAGCGGYHGLSSRSTGYSRPSASSSQKSAARTRAVAAAKAKTSGVRQANTARPAQTETATMIRVANAETKNTLTDAAPIAATTDSGTLTVASKKTKVCRKFSAVVGDLIEIPCE
jgi:activator of HSP90 ATPase